MFPAAMHRVLTLLVATAIYVRADPSPNSPSPGAVFIEGNPCTIGWDADLTGLWKIMNIELMTGDNFDMVTLTLVGTVDGTDASKNNFSYTCPRVTPHAPIYFYQFSSPASSNKTWTGRFTITDSHNDVVAPLQSIQPDGEKIPWGTGSLVNGSFVNVVPSASSSKPSSTPGSSSPSFSLSSSPQPSTFGSPSLSLTSSNTPSPSVVVVTSSLSAEPSTVSTTGTNGAVTMSPFPNTLFQTGLALGIAAFGFITLL